MAHVRRTPFILAASLLVLVPELASAGEPGTAEAVGPQPVAPAAATEGTPPGAAAPAPTATAPTAGTTAVDRTPVVSAPAPAPVLPASMPTAPVPTRTPSDKRTKGMIAGGAGLLLTTYIYSSVLGAIAIDKGRKGRFDAAGMRTRDDERVAFGRRLMIPVVGPFLALGHTDSALKRYGAAFSGVAQVTGAVLLVAGIVGKTRMNRARRFGWTAGASLDGAGVTLTGRF